MKNRTTKSFKDDIRRTLAIYALIPAAIITLFSYLLSFIILKNTMINRNLSANREISRKIEHILTAYADEAMEVATTSVVTEAVRSGQSSVDIYRRMYAFVNNMQIRGEFFVFDGEMTPVIASTSKLPEYTRKEYALKWGITFRLRENLDQVVVERQVSVDTGRKSLSVGKAILDGDRIIGYIIFDLDEEDLADLIKAKTSINVVITDQFGNVILGTNDSLRNQYDKIVDDIFNKSGTIRTENDSYYVSRTEITDFNFCVYSITATGFIRKVKIVTGGILVAFFAMLTVLSYISSEKIAGSKTKVIDDIINAIESVHNGNLDQKLNINTNDEFEVIASSFNQMLDEIKNLIEINKEKARQNSISEIKKLESQFNPHFLFNTLEMIRYMVRMKSGSVDKVIMSLSNLLRYSINATVNEVTIKEDIEYTKNYLLIQKYRLGDKFHYTIDIDKNIYDCIVPKLVVQPMIENAIKYGFEKRHSLTIRIKAKHTGDGMVIVVYDDGAGMKPEVLKNIKSMLYQKNNNSSHMGLYNVHRRIQLMYGEEYGINIMSEANNGTVVKINLPANRREKKC